MTIQISVTIWTLLCFCLLMVILHNLLFKPVLGVMDRRRERIRSAAAKKVERERLAEEYAAELHRKEDAFREEQQKQIREGIERIRSESKQSIEAAREERLRTVDSFRLQNAQEHEEILATLSAHSRDLAAAFAESIVKE